MPLVQAALNSKFLTRLGNRCPLNAFTGLSQDSPLTSFTGSNGEKLEVHSMYDRRKTQKKIIRSLMDTLEKIHKEVSDNSSKKWEQSVFPAIKG